MKTKNKAKGAFPFVIAGSALLIMGLLAVTYLSTRIDDDEIDFDLDHEHISDYA